MLRCPYSHTFRVSRIWSTRAAARRPRPLRGPPSALAHTTANVTSLTGHRPASYQPFAHPAPCRTRGRHRDAVACTDSAAPSSPYHAASCPSPPAPMWTMSRRLWRKGRVRRLSVLKSCGGKSIAPSPSLIRRQTEHMPDPLVVKTNSHAPPLRRHIHRPMVNPAA